MKAKSKTLVVLTESAIMIALATVLSFVKLIDLPYGGSITVGSMLPIIIVAYRHGIKAGSICALCFSVLQLLFGLNNLSYATSWQAGVAIVMLDYIVAFTALGLAAIPRKFIKDNQSTALVTGAILACLIRYICHVISGCTVWAGVSIPDSQGIIYSLSYNATYMIPETIIIIAFAAYLSRFIDLRSETPRAMKHTSSTPFILALIGWLFAIATVTFDTVKIFGVLQNAETGEFDFSLISTAPWQLIGIVTAIGAVVTIIFLIAAHCVKKSASK